MKFAHIADCHIGSWRDPQMKEMSVRAFECAIDCCIVHNVDFILIAGDLFNTSLPSLDRLKSTVTRLKQVHDAGIAVYAIAGSHDYSPSGKTMLDVLEEAGLLVNVVKGVVTEQKKLRLHFTQDKKTGAKITGMLGRRGMLEKSYYEDLDREFLEKESGFKIFMFHTAITELKPKDMERMDSTPVSLLPKGFEYYAGGHVHIVKQLTLDGYKNVVYPGPLFPNSFSELEALKEGGFYIYDDGSIIRETIQLYPVVSFTIDCNKKTPEETRKLIQSTLSSKQVKDAIVTLRLFGTLDSGTISSLDLKSATEFLIENGAYFVMKNTAGLKSREFSPLKIAARSVEDIERTLILEHQGQSPLFTAEKITQFIHSLDTEKKEGERTVDFEARLVDDLDRTIN